MHTFQKESEWNSKEHEIYIKKRWRIRVGRWLPIAYILSLSFGPTPHRFQQSIYTFLTLFPPIIFISITVHRNTINHSLNSQRWYYWQTPRLNRNPRSHFGHFHLPLISPLAFDFRVVGNSNPRSPMSCPINSFRFNASLCACPPGHLLDRTTNTCVLFSSSSAIVIGQAESDAVSFPVTIFSFDSLRMFMQSQAVFLQATLVMLASWLFFCLFLRFMKLGDGRNMWFRMRWWVSRLDLCFATTHWLVSCPLFAT